MEELRVSVTPLLPHLGQLADLHVYLVPVESWIPSQKLWFNYVIHEAVSYGFVRVQTQVNLHDLRSELEEQLDSDVLPKNYVFLRSVGRNFARVKEKQEFQLKVRDFMPPNALEPELYLLESIPELEVLQTIGRSEYRQEVDKTSLKVKRVDGGESRSPEVGLPSVLPSLPFPPVNGGMSSPSVGVSAHSPTVLPPVPSGRTKVTSRVNNNNRATSSIDPVDPLVKFPRIQPNGQVATRGKDRPKSEPRNLYPRKAHSSAMSNKSVTVLATSTDYKSSSSPRSRSRRESSNGKRVTVVANPLKKKRVRPNSHSAILSHQRIVVNNGRRHVARGSDLPDVAEEGEIAKPPMRVEDPGKLRHTNSYGYVEGSKNYPEEFDSPERVASSKTYRVSSRKGFVKQMPIKYLAAPNGGDEDEEKIEEKEKKGKKEKKERKAVDRGDLKGISSSFRSFRPMSTIELRSLEKAAILKYELTVSELKQLRHAACHTSEKTKRPIVVRRTRPIPRTVWYPRPLHEGGNPPPLQKSFGSRRRARAVRDSGHVYYTSSESRGLKKYPKYSKYSKVGGTKNLNLSKKKSRVYVQEADGNLRQVSSARSMRRLTLQSIDVSPVIKEQKDTPKRPPYSRSKRRKKTEFHLPEDKEVEHKSLLKSPTPLPENAGCCEWVIDSVSVEEFANNEEQRKQVLQPIRKAAQEKAKRQADARKDHQGELVPVAVVTPNNSPKAGLSKCSNSPSGGVVLCSVDRPR